MNKYLAILIFQVFYFLGCSQTNSDFKRYVDRAVNYFNNGDYKNAIAYYDSILILKPEMAVAYKSRGQSYLNIGELAHGIQDLEKAISFEPLNIEQYHILGIGYSMNKQELEAIKTLEQGIQIDDSNIDLIITYAGMLFRVGEYEKAKNSYQKIYAIDVNNIDNEYFFGTTLGVLGDSISKTKHLESLLNKEIDDYLRLTIYTELERYNDFKMLKEKVEKTSYDKVYLQILISENYSKQKLYKLAISEYEDLIKQGEHSSSLLNSLSWCLIKSGDYKKALQYCNQLLNENKNDYNALGNRGNVFLKTGNYKSAEIDFKKAIQLRPAHPGVYKLYGDLLMEQGKNNEACTNYKTAIERFYVNLYEEYEILEITKNNCR
ncbi:tetratricopeptide repeat protein [Ulvibacterium marinum]|uniref:tetratricopeptide repeat protein n=1 Tax=Ulvibacterium marinum TaxID=2419782 RepID=UPI002495287C|nr:tetratricopeptide repeat protein [Ulvibacterium marinum]